MPQHTTTIALKAAAAIKAVSKANKAILLLAFAYSGRKRT
jgi:hypothetical protein